MSAYAELADRLMLGYGVTESGITYARRAQQSAKQIARNKILSLFSRDAWPGPLSILTMPSLDWAFEWGLIHARERGRAMTGKMPRRTYITSLERNPAIFHAALRRMPSAHLHMDCRMTTPAFARSVTRTSQIGRFYNCSLEDFVPGMTEHFPKWTFGAAWIDLTGPLTEPMLQTLELLWARTHRILIVTSLKARWPKGISDEIASLDGPTELLLSRLPWSVPLQEHEYRDGSPMHQVALLKVAS